MAETTEDIIKQRLDDFKAITQKYAITPQVLGELLEAIVNTLRGENHDVSLNDCHHGAISLTPGQSQLKISVMRHDQPNSVITISSATQAQAGLMSATDKAKVDNIYIAYNIQGFADVARADKADVYAIYCSLNRYHIKLACAIRKLTFYGRPSGWTGRRYCRIYRISNGAPYLWMKSKNYIDFVSKGTLGEVQGTFDMEIYEGDKFVSPDEQIIIGFVETERSTIFARTGFALDMNISGGVATESIAVPASVQSFSPVMKVEYEISTQSLVDKLNTIV